MKKQLEKYETVHREYILLLEEDEVDEDVKLAEQLKSACLQMSIDATKFIERSVPDKSYDNKQNFMEQARKDKDAVILRRSQRLFSI